VTRYLITFGAHAMDHIASDEMPAVARAAHAVCREMIDAGVFVVSGGLESRPALVVSGDGTTEQGSPPTAVSGITVIDVATDDEARAWAAKIATACRCAQEVRALGYDPELDAMLRGVTP
jgi:hypothetical protein